MKSNNELFPIFDGRVLVNETALHDQAVMNALQSASLNNFEYVNHCRDHVTINDWITSSK